MKKSLITGITTIMLALSLPSGQQPSAAVFSDGSLMRQKAINKAKTEYEVTYMSDGLKVKGFLYLPTKKYAGKSTTAKNVRKSPAIIFAHGGVGGVPSPLKRRARELAARGYVVFAPSYRGEDGSDGEIEVAAGEVNDVLNAAKYVRALPVTDPRRVALIGASHGGIITLLAIQRDDSFRAAVCAYGVTDTFTWYQYLIDSGHDVTDPLSRKVYGDGPSDKPAAFRNRAPALDAGLVRTPLLLIYGEKDITVPPSQGREMSNALKSAARPHEFFIVPSVGHGFLFFLDPSKHTAEEMKNASDAWRKVVSFVDAHI